MTRASGSDESAPSTQGTAGRYAAVINEHRPGLLTWVESQRTCEPACGTGEALALQYDALLEMARAFQIDLAVASPPRAEAKELVSRTELHIRDLRRKTVAFRECTRTTPALGRVRDRTRRSGRGLGSTPRAVLGVGPLPVAPFAG